MATQIFLNDVEPHGGDIVVWPGSHRRLAKLVHSDPGHFEYLHSVQEAIESGEIDLGEPVEVTPGKGNVLFYAWLIAYSGSINVSQRPRLAINLKLPGEQEPPPTGPSRQNNGRRCGKAASARCYNVRRFGANEAGSF